jgi:hypothetical protein
MVEVLVTSAAVAVLRAKTVLVTASALSTFPSVPAESELMLFCLV